MASPATSCTSDLRTPAWVVNVREEISRSPAWEVLSDQLYERVSIALESHGLGHFSDLSSAEQITLLEEAHRDISSEDNKVYKAFESQFGKSMDAEIAKEARVRVDQDEAAKRDGTDEALYLDRILDSAAEGAVSLLKELPREHLGSLRLMLNQPVPSRARLDIWRLLLKHTAVREEYELLMKQNRNSTISGQDIYITHRCQALLESGRVASRRLLPLTSLNVVLMKTVLSYHHARKMGQPGDKATPDLPESFVHFLVPLCAVATSSPSSRSSSNATAASNVREQKIESQIEGLVEMFAGALEAGLAGLVDPNESGGGAGSVITARAKKTQKASKAARVVEPPIGGGGGTGEVVLPFWVDKVHGVLLPGFKGLVDHVTRAHLGLAVAAPIDGGASEHKREGGRDGGDGETSFAAHEKLQAGKGGNNQQQQLEGEVTAEPPSPRRGSSSSRRAALQSRGGRPSSAANNNNSSTDGSTAAFADNVGGGVEDEKAGDTPTRRRSSIISPGEDTDNVKTLSIPSEVVPPPSVSEAQARAALYALLKPLVTVGLVGYLSADACLFAWDQAVIGGFGVMLPLVAAMVVAAAADKMQACSTFSVMSEALLSHAHIVSTSQLQELMEKHCMPSIRTEMRVSHKLSPEIVGPSLKTATEILHSAYSKRTKETQKARKAHVEHVLGPSKGGPINRINAEERFQLDLTKTTTHGSGGSSSGGNSVDPQYDHSSDDGDDDDDDGSDNTRGKKSASSRLGKVKGGLGGRERERKDKDRSIGSKKKSTWRSMLTHRSTSNTVASVDAGGEATSAKGGRGDHSSTRDRHNNKRENKKKVEAAAEAPTTSGSAAANVSSSKLVGGNKKGKNKATGLTGADNANIKANTKTNRKSGNHNPENESADDANVDDGDGGRNRTSSKRPTAGATAGTRKGSSASSSLAQESTGRSVESSFTRSSEREATLDDEEETASWQERSTHSESRRQKSSEESNVSSDDEGSVSEDRQAGTKKENSSTRLINREKTTNATSDSGSGGGGTKKEKSSTRVIDRKKTTNNTSDSGGGGGGAEGGNKAVGNKAEKRESSASTSRHSHVSRRSRERDGREETSQNTAKGASKTRQVSKQEKTPAVARENTTSEGGVPTPEPAAAAKPAAAAAAATSASTSAPKSPLKRWLGFGGRKKASPSSSPAKGKKSSRKKTITDASNWMLD